METKTMTREQLRVEIAQLQGNCPCNEFVQGYTDSFNPCLRERCRYCGRDKNELYEWGSDVAAAMGLFADMRFPTLETWGDGWKVGWGQASGERNQGEVALDFCPFDDTKQEQDSMKQICLTIFVAFYEWKTGVRAEVIDAP